MTQLAAVPPVVGDTIAGDHRGSWLPTGRMITTRIMELRRRRGMMIALIVVNIGLPTIFLTVRLIAHAVAPKSYSQAGGYDIFTNLVAGVMFVFGFIVAATLGATAGSADLGDGMFRHLVVTGRSRLALYLARIPAGLAVVVPIVAVGFAIVCTVCVYAAPTVLRYQGVAIPAGLSEQGFEQWAGAHATTFLCDLPGPTPPQLPCGGGPGGGGITIIKSGLGPQGTVLGPLTPGQLSAAAERNARVDFSAYHQLFLYPSNSLMIKTGLWVELEAAIGLIVGIGLASLLGQRTISVVLMIVLEVIITPIASHSAIPHMINLQRAFVGLAMAHIEPGGLPLPFAGNSNNPNGPMLVHESTTVAICVIVAWIVGWTALGAWRMVRRDA
ncbi:MAG: hypothetical protein ACYDD4_06070 [Acidimicrobiales bacterium]